MEEAKRQRILEAATKVFVKEGYKDASIDEIARVADVAKGTVYLACESKADLFYQAVHLDLKAWGAQISRFVDPRMSASEIIAKMAQNGPVYLAEHPLTRGLFSGAHYGLAFLLMKRGDLPGAERHLEAFLAKPPAAPESERWVRHAQETLRVLRQSEAADGHDQ